VPHSFPSRRFRAGEVVDPDVLNAAFQGIVPKLAGRIGEQDISTDVKGKLTIADEAYYDGHHVVKASDPDLVDNTAAGYPYATIAGDGAADPPAVVEDSATWQSIQDDNGTDTMSLDISCGEGDVLVMFGMLQHFAWTGTGPSAISDIDAPLKLQYAFEVDGTILENSITGAAVWPDPPPQMWYRATPANSGGAKDEFDYRHIQYLQNTLGISHGAGAHRILYTTTMQSGSHNVALKARRLPMSDYKIDSGGDGTTVKLFNRRLFVLRIKGQSPRTDSGSSLVVDVFEDGDVLRAADITTDGFSKLATEVNDLDSGNIARGAFRYEHLSSVVYGAKATSITPSGTADTFAADYPGYGTNSVNWEVVSDGGGNDLLLAGPTAGQWDLATYPGTMVVLANVQVNYIKWSVASVSNLALGLLALRITNSLGTVTLLGETEVCVNGHSFDNETVTPTSADLDIDVPLMWVVDSADLSAADKHITKIEVVACVWDAAGGANTVEMGTQRGMLTAFVLKGVHLA
jgi:hypothetical protein